MQETQKRVARALLEIGAVGFTPHEPITFKSGLKSPVYVDNRRLPFWPEAWQVVLDGLQAAIAAQGIPVDVVAGIETAGIPHSATLAYILRRPSVFVRKAVKEHGTRSRIEGGDVSGRRVLLVEDLVTTGGSSLDGVEALREGGAVVEDCLAIVSYGFPEAGASFRAAGVRLTPLTPFRVILQEALPQGRLDRETLRAVEDWLRDPHGWAACYGFA